MFNNLFDFSYTRSIKEAIGFYIAFLFLFMLLGGILGGVSTIVFGVSEEEAFDFGVKIGSVLGVVLTLVLAAVVLHAKKLYTHFGYIVLGLLSGVLAIFVGGIGGLIPVTYLTTRPASKGSELPTSTTEPHNETDQPTEST